MNPRVRETAIYLRRARECLIAGEVAKAADNIELYSQFEARFRDAWGHMPLGVQVDPQKYLYLPVRRMIERKGLLHYRGRIAL